MSEPTNGEIIQESVKASNANAELILSRIEASDRHINELVSAHEIRDQERFTAQTEVVQAHNHDINRSLMDLKTEVHTTNNRLSKVEFSVGLVEDRAAVLADLHAKSLNLRHGIAIAIAGAAVSGLVVLIIHLTT